MRVLRLGIFPFFDPAVWWQITPKILPTSPRPRFSQPSTKATFSPAFFSTPGNQISECGMLGYTSFRHRQIFVWCYINDIDVASVDGVLIVHRIWGACPGR